MRADKIVQAIFLAMAIVGIFAAMARNAYGYTLLGWACLGLAALYLANATWNVVTEYSSLTNEDRVHLAELVLLALFLSLFGFRAFYIYIPFAEYYFLAICFMLAMVYSIAGYIYFTRTSKENKSFSVRLMLLYGSVILFLLSIGTRVFTGWSLVPGALGLLVSLILVVFAMRRVQYEVNGKPVTISQVVIQSKHKAGLLLIFFLSAVLYTTLTYANIIPAIENSVNPKAYIQLIDDAERRREEPVDGTYKHELYKEAMDRFLDRHDPARK